MEQDVTINIHELSAVIYKLHVREYDKDEIVVGKEPNKVDDRVNEQEPESEYKLLRDISLIDWEAVIEIRELQGGGECGVLEGGGLLCVCEQSAAEVRAVEEEGQGD